MIEILPSNLSGNIEIISSKSDIHRKLICSALSKNKSKLIFNNASTDVKSTISCLNSLGANIKKFDDFYQIIPIDFENISDKRHYFDVEESGSTIRFILPIFHSLIKNGYFTGKGSLLNRPLDDIVDLMEENGTSFSSRTLPLEVKGKFSFQNAKIKGKLSSQYLSGLLMASPLQKKDVRIEVLENLSSRPYVDMTIKTMEEFGIKIKEEDNKFLIGKSEYQSPEISKAEGDYSNAAFFLVAGAIGENSKISVSGLSKNSLQGDKKILDILKVAGAKVDTNWDLGKVTVSKNKISPFKIDMEHIPDLLPVLCVLATTANGKSLMYNAKRLKYKESDRIKSSYELITNLGGRAKITEDGIIIEGSQLKGGSVFSFNDHRIAMSAAIAAAICEKPVILDGESAVNKSYPEFFEEFKRLGGRICPL